MQCRSGKLPASQAEACATEHATAGGLLARTTARRIAVGGCEPHRLKPVLLSQVAAGGRACAGS
jgi:hypothetical protein